METKTALIVAANFTTGPADLLPIIGVYYFPLRVVPISWGGPVADATCFNKSESLNA